MEVWKDITSFQAIDRFLTGSIINKSDIYDFMQFCTELIYCDNIFVSLHGPKEMANRTKSIRDKLVSFGVDKDFIKLFEFDNTKMIKQTLSNIGVDMHFHIENIKIDRAKLSDTHDAQFPEAYIDKLKPTTDILKKVLVKNKNRDNFKEEIKESLKDDKYNIALYTLLKDDFLVEELRRSMKNQFWNNQHLLGLVASTRVSINQTISKKNNLFYSPAYLRSLKNRDFTSKTENTKILLKYLNKYEKNIFDSDDSFMSTDIGLPSAIKLFLMNGNDSPLKILDKAINTRNELNWLRTTILSDVNNIYYENEDLNKFNTLQNELKKCTKEILYSLGTKATTHETLKSNMSIVMNMSSSLLLGPTKDMDKMIKFHSNRKDYILISDILNCARKNDKDFFNAKIHDLYLKNMFNIS